MRLLDLLIGEWLVDLIETRNRSAAPGPIAVQRSFE